jgi:hypothetical protein
MFKPHRLARAVLTLAIAGCAVAAPATASAQPPPATTSNFFTVNIADSPPASPFAGSTKRFVAGISGVIGTPVSLQRYVANPGRLLQHWAIVDSQWPDSDTDVRGAFSIFDMFTKCTPPITFCGFEATGGKQFPPMKLVNRDSGLCLTMSKVRSQGAANPDFFARAMQDKCVKSGDLQKRQVWQIHIPTDQGPEASGVRNVQANLMQKYEGRQRCLNFPGGTTTDDSADQFLSTAPCSDVWFQSFRFLLVGTATCAAPWRGLCGVPPRR